MDIKLTTIHTKNQLLLIAGERARQNSLKASGRFANTCADPIPDSVKLSILTEELGEVAKELNEREINAKRGRSYRSLDASLKTELCQVAAVVVAWMESL